MKPSSEAVAEYSTVAMEPPVGAGDRIAPAVQLSAYEHTSQ
jgi:hypothetical protein